MAKWNQLVITDAGYQLSAQTLSGKKIQYTHAQTTDKDMSSMTSDELKSITKLDSVVQDLPICVVSVQDDHTVNVPVKVTNQDVTADYLLCGLAIFAKSEDGDEVLYGIATAAKPDLIVAQDGKTVVGTNFWLKVHVGSADNVNIVISPDGSISNEELEGILKQYVLDSNFKAALDDYVKKDEVAGLIPDDIATTKNLADGDAETLKSAKEYADAQVSDKVKAADTANWQKAKISADDGSPKSFLYAKDGGNVTMWIAGRPLGIHTFWCAAGITGNPVSSSIQGTMSISSVKNGVGYCVSADGDFISITLVDGQVNYDILTKKSDIDPSVIVKTTLTASDDVLTLDYGSYTISGPLPKNAPDLENTGINWGALVVHKTLSGANKTLEYRDVKGNVLINILSGKPLTWSGWHMPNQDSLAIGAGANKIAANGNTFVPLAINVATGEICLPDGTAITLSLPGGVKLGDHMLNISATDGLTIDNQAYFTAVADEATAASKAAADPLHNYTTEE
ncbi:hypothetical protein [Levilactobacillus brevis]|uniref:hypothetical protein n=1 Tax=Levilactobacillus brevis TaxID=1580 RepID=UPI000F5011B1|nr:hypothetical protein [Levilactobacillus brevis]